MHVKHLIPLAAGIALAGSAVLALNNGGLQAQSALAASETGTLGATKTAVADRAFIGQQESGVHVVNAVRLGDDRFVIGRVDDEMRLAVSLNGSSFDRNWESFGTIDGATVPADAIQSVSSGNTAGHLANLAGYAGADVTAITVHTVAGGDVKASLRDGTFLAAWDGQDLADQSTLGTTATLSLKNGTSRTVAWNDGI